MKNERDSSKGEIKQGSATSGKKPSLVTGPGFSARSSAGILVIILLLSGMGYLYWKSSQRFTDSVLSRYLVMDETGTLTDVQKKDISSFSSDMLARHGFGLMLRVFEDHAAVPDPDTRMIFMGLSPDHEQVIIVWPPVLKRAITPEVIHYLEQEHFLQYWEDDWPAGVVAAMDRLLEELNKIEQ